jgi:hypothetical protein
MNDIQATNNHVRLVWTSVELDSKISQILLEVALIYGIAILWRNRSS